MQKEILDGGEGKHQAGGKNLTTFKNRENYSTGETNIQGEKRTRRGKIWKECPSSDCPVQAKPDGTFNKRKFVGGGRKMLGK